LIEAGAWVTVTVSVLGEIATRLPPPEAFAVLLTFTGELFGMLTFSIRTG
jgi:hypothetical protein